MGSDGLAPRPDERQDSLFDLDAFRVGNEQARVAFHAWLREGLSALVDVHCGLARGPRQTYRARGHRGRPWCPPGDGRPRGRYYRVESWYVPSVPCSRGSPFMYRITLMPCVGAGSADGTSRSFWGGRRTRTPARWRCLLVQRSREDHRVIEGVPHAGTRQFYCPVRRVMVGYLHGCSRG